MNPETKLTNEQIRAICEKHGISYSSHNRIITGFSHEVHKLNGDLIIKLYTPERYENYQTEAAILKSDLPFPKPKFVLADTDESTGRSFIVMSFVPGRSLGGMWHRASNERRENLIKSICGALKTINQIDPKLINADTSKSWQQTMRATAHKLAGKLLARNIIDVTTDAQVRKAVERYTDAMTDDKQFIVFWDVHFDNFIVNDDFELQAVIDLESTILASLDYPLFVLQKMTDLPHKYLREDEEKYADVKDYVHLKEWYRKYFPEMFGFDNLDTRLKLYQLIDALHLLQNWSTHKENHEELSRLMS